MKHPSRYFIWIVLTVSLGGLLQGCKDAGSEPAPGPPGTPIALPATIITQTGFTANWQAAANAAEYRLDVARDSLFALFITGYQDKNVGAVTSSGVSGLAGGTRFFYRVRALGGGGISQNSNTIGVTLSTSAGISFKSRVLPILTNYGCTGCHGGSGGLFVGTVAQLLAGGNHGAAIVPFSSGNSNLVRKLVSPPPFGARMPLGGSALPSDTIDVIRQWIDEGAIDN